MEKNKEALNDAEKKQKFDGFIEKTKNELKQLY